MLLKAISFAAEYSYESGDFTAWNESLPAGVVAERK